MKCNFVLITDNRYQCEKCHFVLQTDKPINKIIRSCGKMSLKEKIVSVAEVIATGPSIAAESKSAERLEICKTCEHYENSTCKFCSCNMPFKTMVENARCPIGKW